MSTENQGFNFERLVKSKLVESKMPGAGYYSGYYDSNKHKYLLSAISFKEYHLNNKDKYTNEELELLKDYYQLVFNGENPTNSDLIIQILISKIDE